MVAMTKRSQSINIILRKGNPPTNPRFDIWVMLLALAACRCGRVQAFQCKFLHVSGKAPLLSRSVESSRRLASHNESTNENQNQRLDYEHGFHAGNFADVFKHSILILVLQKMLQKNKPMTYVETHAGAGLYKYDIKEGTDANGEESQEFQRGIGGLLTQQQNEVSSTNQTAVSTYLDIVQSVQPATGNDNGDASTMIYPGSPFLQPRCFSGTSLVAASKILQKFHTIPYYSTKKQNRNTNN